MTDFGIGFTLQPSRYPGGSGCNLYGSDFLLLMTGFVISWQARKIHGLWITRALTRSPPLVVRGLMAFQKCRPSGKNGRRQLRIGQPLSRNGWPRKMSHLSQKPT